MFTVFIDDSGTSTTQPIAIASALILPATRIAELDDAWNNFLSNEFIPEFHTSECAAGQAGTPFADWSWQRKRLACGRVREITKRFAVGACSVAITKKDYDDIVTGELREFGGKFHYTWAVWAVIRNLDMWAAHNKIQTPFEYVFDWMGEPKRNDARKEIENVMAQAEWGRPGFYEGHYSFRHRKDHPSLQCADLLAWTCYQFARSAYLKSATHPIAWESYWDFDAYKNQQWLLATVQTREDLQRWTQSESKDEVRKSRRKEWLNQLQTKRP